MRVYALWKIASPGKWAILKKVSGSFAPIMPRLDAGKKGAGYIFSK